MIKEYKKRLSQFWVSLGTSNAKLYAFILFFVLVFFTGGSSRDDIQSLVILRPIAILFAAYALITMNFEHWRDRLFPLYICLAFLALMIVQLIPLPPTIWMELPGRKIFGEIALAAGIEQSWRPLSLSPSRTLNSLFSLAIPLSALLLYLNLERAQIKQALTAILVLIVVSAVWAVFQLVGPAGGPLYLYDITNHGAAVGLMANRNHQAILLACAIVMLGWYASTISVKTRLAALKFYGSIGSILILVTLIFVTGSRAGLILIAPALIVAMVLIYFGRFVADNSRSTGHRSTKGGRLSFRQGILVFSIAVIVALGALSIWLSRALAFERLFGGGENSELRVELFPTLYTMMQDYLPWGSGFGSFEHVYRIYEPQNLLSPQYLNQAHNDWLQLLIEGGVAIILIGVCAASWFILRLVKLARAWRNLGSTKYSAMMVVTVMLFCLAGSIGDYPLRTPSIVALFAVFACTFGDSARSEKKKERKLDHSVASVA